jgi:hypothetical protein
MKKYLFFIAIYLFYCTGNSQIFVSQDGLLHLTNASGGELRSPEAISQNVGLYVDSSITIVGQFINDSCEVQLTGDLLNTGTFTSHGDEVFIGTKSQTISGNFINANNFYNLIINKNAGNFVELDTIVEINVNGILNLNQGLIKVNPTNYIHIKNTDSAAILNGGNNGALDKFIKGELRRAIVSGPTYAFPVGDTYLDDAGGDGLQYAFLKSNNGNGIGSVSFTAGDGIGIVDSSVICPLGLGDYKDVEYRLGNGFWEITNPLGGIENYNITLHPADFINDVYFDYTILKNGLPTGSDKCDGVSNSLPIKHDSLISFSKFEVAASQLTPLPIDLILFETSVLNNKTVKLNWQIGAEINNNYFTIERSDNVYNWEAIKTIEGAGNSSVLLNYTSFDENPLKGISYYRLKQTDFDGKFEYSKIRSINITDLGHSPISIYPNPILNQVTLKASPLKLGQITIYNIMGQDFTLLTRKIEQNDDLMVIDFSQLSTGTYFIKTTSGTYKIYKL